MKTEQINLTTSQANFDRCVEILRNIPQPEYWAISVNPKWIRLFRHAFHKQTRYEFMSKGKHGLRRTHA